MKSKLLFYLGCICLICVVACKKSSPTDPTTKLAGVVFGTTYSIKYVADTDYKTSIDSLFQITNASLSTYIADSDISRINAGDTTVVVDNLFLEVFQKSKRIYKETSGYFDPTVCNLVNAWGFGYKKEQQDLDSAQVKTLMAHVGFDKIVVNDRKLRKEDAAVCLDFNSIAKGYGIDVVGRFLESKGIVNYLVEIGGEIRARGVKFNGELWKVGIDNPNTDGSRSFSKLVTLDNQSMASSGNYRKFRIGANGKKYVHTINPKTGFAVESNLLSATVFAPGDCADVDAYATAFMAMGFEKTKLFLAKFPELRVVLLYVNQEGSIQEYTNY
ncbi:FAD:protein FMN transferase [Tenacibaculum sp. SG-28]|uniref:FAD:protein FMN transferase n=1 Tax=Tenacibaculum sp. SG-28 TaxID=754426 RepID=UPI000CF4DDA0|nr:FAD:protein FMN transferase [Tenacibaculum sp. SG-28]